MNPMPENTVPEKLPVEVKAFWWLLLGLSAAAAVAQHYRHHFVDWTSWAEIAALLLFALVHWLRNKE
jgi:hypothetical protein